MDKISCYQSLTDWIEAAIAADSLPTIQASSVTENYNQCLLSISRLLSMEENPTRRVFFFKTFYVIPKTFQIFFNLSNFLQESVTG
jgi:hypothetical protein